MKILYAIQGTGNGHLARATEIIPQLQEIAETDILISGTQGDIQLPFNVKYQFYGISFIFGTQGGVNIWKTLLQLNVFKFFRDISKLPVNQYDIVICDFEPVSAWACKLKRKKCIGLSHQLAVLHPKAPKPKRTNWIGKLILKVYAPVTEKYGFHFEALGNTVFSPVIRSAIRNSKPTNYGHYTVYLPSYSNEEIEDVLLTFPFIQWEVFSKHCDKTYRIENVLFRPVSLEKFTKSFINCEGIICNAGFETPAEALFMGKKLCVIPMRNQYEQQCNSAFLKKMGIPVMPKLKNQIAQIKNWIESSEKKQINYQHYIGEVLGMILLKEIEKAIQKNYPVKDSCFDDNLNTVKANAELS